MGSTSPRLPRCTTTPTTVQASRTRASTVFATAKLSCRLVHRHPVHLRLLHHRRRQVRLPRRRLHHRHQARRRRSHPCRRATASSSAATTLAASTSRTRSWCATTWAAPWRSSAPRTSSARRTTSWSRWASTARGLDCDTKASTQAGGGCARTTRSCHTMAPTEAPILVHGPPTATSTMTLATTSVSTS